MRTIKEILEDEKKCAIGNTTKEVAHISFKVRNNLPLTNNESLLMRACMLQITHRPISEEVLKIKI